MRPQFLFKVLTVGAAAVGKTSLILRYTTGKFREYYSPTLGADFSTKFVDTDEGAVRLQIWDLGSQDFLGRVRAKYYRGARGVIYAYDVTRRSTFNDVVNWQNEVTSHIGGTVNLLIANKTDLIDRAVSEKEGRELAMQLPAEYVETSVKLNKGVDDVFVTIAERILAKPR